MNKRDVIFSLLDDRQLPPYTPAAFFLHFDPIYHTGQAAIDKHLEYFQYTNMDFVKIQFEQNFPHLPFIQKADDWAKMPFYDLDFYREQLAVVKGLITAAKRDALVLLTLYSPFMCAAHSTNEDLLTRHILENPDAVKAGMQILTDSLMGFVKACIQMGLDGFYTSTQGGEAARLPDRSYFDQCIRPFDLALMQEANRGCDFNILHICDYALPYDDLTPYLDYPGQIVNASLDLTTKKMTPKEIADMFQRPFMGGLERLGVLATGSKSQVETEVNRVLLQAPERFVLAADCTVPKETPWENLKTAINLAHQYRHI